MHATARSRARQQGEAFKSPLAKAVGEIGDSHQVQGFLQFSGLAVVILDRGKAPAQTFLDHGFEMRHEVIKTAFDRGHLVEHTIAEQRFVVFGQIQQRRKCLA